MKPGESKSLTVLHSIGGPDAVGEALRAADAFAGALALPAGKAARLAIVVEELVANLFEHGGVGADDRVELSFAGRGGDVMLILEDPGRAFDPRAAPGPGEVPPERGGGAGLAMVAAWTRVLRYEASGGANRLELLIPADEGERADDA